MIEKKPETLKEAIDQYVQTICDLSELGGVIDDTWGVTLCTMFVDHHTPRATIFAERGIEEIDMALREPNGATMLHKCFNRLELHCKKLKAKGIVDFVQRADEKTGVFVKAGKKPPKVLIVEDDDD